jgi:hypothetical protein
MHTAWAPFVPQARGFLSGVLNAVSGPAIEAGERAVGDSVADLEKVVAQYPRSLDARRELGKSYYRQNRLQDAKV